MRMGVGLILVTLGAILRFAVEDNVDGVDLETIGVILMVIGGVAFITSVALEFTKRPAATPMPPSGYPPAQTPPAQTPPQAPAPPR